MQLAAPAVRATVSSWQYFPVAWLSSSYAVMHDTLQPGACTHSKSLSWQLAPMAKPDGCSESADAVDAVTSVGVDASITGFSGAGAV